MCDFHPQCIEWDTGVIPVGNLFEWAYLTRREDYENHEEGKNVSMIVNTECLKAGTVLDGGMDISEHLTEIERACIGMGLKLLQDTGYIGAENRRGLGQVDIKIENAPNYEAYETYLREKRLEILTYLEEIGAINASGELNFSGD
jgi:CRISPR/Cas system CSM-associated protein Csm3 (group 7 of RAMP superfamily)